MAAGEYLQAAAGQLENAANALKLEADSLRGEHMTYDREASKEISGKENEIHAINARLAAGQPDATEAAMHIRIQLLQREIEQKKREQAEKSKKLNDDIRSKEGSMSDLMNKARDLRNQATGLR